jgi:hypothetical protein
MLNTCDFTPDDTKFIKGQEMSGLTQKPGCFTRQVTSTSVACERVFLGVS